MLCIEFNIDQLTGLTHWNNISIDFLQIRLELRGAHDRLSSVRSEAEESVKRSEEARHRFENIVESQREKIEVGFEPAHFLDTWFYTEKEIAGG